MVDFDFLVVSDTYHIFKTHKYIQFYIAHSNFNRDSPKIFFLLQFERLETWYIVMYYGSEQNF